jgi:hypothetical protein
MEQYSNSSREKLKLNNENWVLLKLGMYMWGCICGAVCVGLYMLGCICGAVYDTENKLYTSVS